MCLLLLARTGRPSEEAIRNSESGNRDGIGIAWKENDILRYEKGISVDQAIEYSKTLPLGFCLHFRMASIGGVCKELIHPFPVRPDVPLKEKGKANKLLFHNGHFTEWKEVLLKHLTERFVLPKGAWSDTRALALLSAIHGRQFLNLIGWGNKFAFMTPTKVHLIGQGWIEDRGVWYSNSGYKYESYASSRARSTSNDYGYGHTPSVYGHNSDRTTPDITPSEYQRNLVE